MKVLTSFFTFGIMALSLQINATSSERVAAPLLSELNNCGSATIELNYKTHSSTNYVTRGENAETFFHAQLTEAGTLAEMVGDRILEIDSIAVEGPVNDADFNTLWNGTFNGRLKIINIENATVEGNKIPDYALFHIDEQVDWSDVSVYVTCLEKLMLPKHLDEIGEFAFAYTTHVTDIQWPTDLKIIGASAFTDNISYSPEKLVLPETLVWIGDQSFYHCYEINGEVILPGGLKRIYPDAFYQCRITKINIPQSLEYLGANAFYGSRFTEAYLPDDCYLGPEGGQFYNNWNLAVLRLPRRAEFVPAQICDGCNALTSVEMPESAKEIDEFAFSGCKISQIDLGSAVETIGMDVFQGCGLTSILLPASLNKLGDRAFALCYQLKNIYCKAPTPPEHTPSYDGTFNGFISSGQYDIPVYIPVGTKQLYQAASGWNLFTNFIETDDFPEAGVPVVSVDSTTSNSNFYDLNGRTVINPMPGQIYIRDGIKIVWPYTMAR